MFYGTAIVATTASCAGGSPGSLATGGAAGAFPAGVTAQMVSDGEGVFEAHCTTCHGTQGEGTTMAPGLDDTEWSHADGSFESIVEVVNDGVAEPVQSFIPMLPRAGSDLSDAEVRAVAAYVWSLTNGA